MAWPSCAPVLSWVLSPRRCWVLRACSSSRDGVPAAQMTHFPEEACVLHPARVSWSQVATHQYAIQTPTKAPWPVINPAGCKNRPESPGYSPAQVMINGPLRALEVTLIMRKFPRAISSAEGPGEGPCWRPTLTPANASCLSRVCSLQ